MPPIDPEVGQIVVPPTENPLTHEQYTALCESFDPLQISDTCNGVDVYCAVRQYVYDILQ